MKTKERQSAANQGTAPRVESQASQGASGKQRVWSGFEQAILRYWPHSPAASNGSRG